jgi:alpha-amylase/alpha-mannosidase (GH57 family)
VILDGENAWEYYPDNAFHFIGCLYERLAQAEDIELTTFAEAVDSCPSVELPRLCPGSWVYGSFSTWIGEEDKNRAWDRLVEAKLAYDEVLQQGVLDAEQQRLAGLQLAVCEGSDWFWWFGDYNPSDSVRDFDELYRLQLKNLYRMLQLEVPANLDEPLSRGGRGAENAGTMRRGHE